jgi:type II secretory pathway component GspD/PulD (secretin)
MLDLQVSRVATGWTRVGVRSLIALVLFCSTSALGHAQQTPTLPGIPRPAPGVGDRIPPTRNAAAQDQPRLDVREDVDTPVVDRPGEPAPRPAGVAAPAIRVIGGGAAGVARQPQAAVGAYEPFRKRPLVYDDVPDVGEDMTITGPMAVMQFLDEIAFATAWNIVASETVQAIQLQFWFTDVRPKVALEILKFYDVFYRFDDQHNMLFVMTKDDYLSRQYGEIVEAEFKVRHANVADIEPMVGSFLSPEGRLVIDPRTGTFFVFDTKDNIQAVAGTLARLDVPLTPRTYRLRHIDAVIMADSVETMLTERGTVQIDSRTNTLVVTDLPARQEQIAEMVETLDRQLVTKTWTIKYADPQTVAENVEILIPEEMGRITVNEEIHQITITAIPERIEEVDALIRTWDIKRDQVQIEAYLITASTRVARRLGVDWAYFGEIGNTVISTQFRNPLPGTSDVNIGQLPAAIPLRNPLTGNIIENIEGDPIIRNFKGDNVSVVLHYLDSRGDISILTQPRVTVQDGEEASFENTQSIPYVSSSFETPRSRLQPDGDRIFDYRTNNQIAFLDVGTILKVLPRVTQERNILLDISAEESSAEIITITASNEANSVPQKRQNKAETQVRVHDGQTVVIGGLRQANVNDDVSKVPILGDLPIIKHAFRSRNKANNNAELMIFITCTIVSEFTHPEAEKLARVNAGMSNELRKDGRPFWQRLADSVAQGNYEIGISIGQSGDLWSRGENVTLDDLERAFREIREKQKARVVIFKHPRAPEEISIDVAELAMQLGMRVEYDTRVTPFVPNYAEPPASAPLSLQDGAALLD